MKVVAAATIVLLGAARSGLGFTRDAVLIRPLDDAGAPHATAYRLLPARP